MSTTDVVLGMVLLAVPLAAAVLLALGVIRAWLPRLDRVERAVAAALVAVGFLLGIHVVPLIAGVLSRGSVLVVSAVVALAAVPLLRRPGTPAPHAAPRPAAGLPEQVLGYGIAAAVAAWALANMRELLPKPLGSVDTITFHLPNVARWMDSGSLWQIDQFIPLQSQGTYPNHGDVLMLWSVLPFDNDFFVRVPMLALFVAFGLTIWAVGRELGAPGPASAAAAASLCTLPIFANATLRAALPDVLLAFGLAATALFGLRWARTRADSDLVLAGLGLGLAFGTKWYGLTTLVVVVVVVAVLARSVRAGALLGAVAVGVGGIWLLRNWVEIGNPFFPLDTPLFDAPRDVVAERVGFSISDYFFDPGVLFGDLPGEIVEGLGWIALALTAACLPALRELVRIRDERALGLLLCAAGLALAYTTTPNTALGFEDDPVQANFNTRYALPALIAATSLALWGVGRVPRTALAVQAVLGVAVALALGDAFVDASAKSVVLGAFAVAGVVALALLARRAPVPAMAIATVVVLGAILYLDRQQERLNDTRYASVGDPVLTAIAKGDAAPGSLRIAIAGDWNADGFSPVWPSFGARITNEVEVIGYDADGFLTNYAEPRGFTAALGRAQPDALVVGRGLAPKPNVVPKEERWAKAAGWTEVAHSDRLALLVPPAP